MQTTGLPLLPDRAPSLGRAISKAAYALALARTGLADTNPARLIKGDTPVDKIASAIIRAATSGAVTGNDAWAGALIGTSTSLWFGELQGSAASGLIRLAGGPLPMTEGRIVVPGVARGSIIAGVVDEAAPIPVVAGTTEAAFLTLSKVACIVVASRELFRASAAERLFRAALDESAGTAIDMFYFATTTGGLLDGITPLASLGDALSDFSLLAGTVGAAGSGAVIAFCCGRGLAAELRIRSGSLFGDTPPPILGSLALADDQLVAVDTGDVAHGISPIAEITAANSASLVMDTDPAQFATEGTPNVAAAPIHSMWQSSQIALRMICEAGYTRRRAGAVAMVSPIAWGPTP